MEKLYSQAFFLNGQYFFRMEKNDIKFQLQH
jgi:hypothetical protein